MRVPLDSGCCSHSVRIAALQGDVKLPQRDFPTFFHALPTGLAIVGVAKCEAAGVVAGTVVVIVVGTGVGGAVIVGDELVVGDEGGAVVFGGGGGVLETGGGVGLVVVGIITGCGLETIASGVGVGLGCTG
jgi:hypothetical protein